MKDGLYFRGKKDSKTKFCFITAYEVSYHTLRKLYPHIDRECFINKPIEPDEFVKIIKGDIKWFNSVSLML